MKKILSILFIFFTICVNAQLDKITPGMPLEEFRKDFPKAERDMWSTGYSVNAKNNPVKYPGKGGYGIQFDTVVNYFFDSDYAIGPCAEFPLEEDDGLASMLQSAKEAEEYYSVIYGKPTEFSIKSPLDSIPFPDDTVNNYFHDLTSVFYANWKWENDELTISVHHLTKSLAPVEDANGPGATILPLGANGKYYTLSIYAHGNGKQLKTEFGIGMSGEEFQKFKPEVAGQIKNKKELIDNWHMRDTIATGRGMRWNFGFVDNKLTSFDVSVSQDELVGYDSTGKSIYIKPDSAYSLIKNVAQKLIGEVENQYGKPISDTNRIVGKYPGKELTPASYSTPDSYYRKHHLRKHSTKAIRPGTNGKTNSNYYSYDRIWYAATWNINGKNLFIDFTENGGSSTDFKLTIQFGEEKWK
jgi:hypothetical protein